MRADDAKAILAELFRPRWADEKSHVAFGLDKPAAKIAANCTGADNKDPHSHASIASNLHYIGLREQKSGQSVNVQNLTW
jgi:hypothetical protein